MTGFRAILPCLFLVPSLWAQSAPASATNKWEREIQNYEARDQSNRPAEGGILFVGSSTIRMWKSAAADFAPLPVLNRGFGGSSFRDLLYFTERIVLPYKPRVLLVYEGDNDLASSNRKAEEVLTNAKAFAAKVHAALPKAKIYFLSIKPSLKRAGRWEEMEKANALVAEWARSDERLGAINIEALIRGADGEPDPSLFKSDKLHLNDEGYRRLTAHLKPILEAAFKP